MPIGYQYATPSELRHEMRRNQIARAVYACLAALRFDLLKPVANGHIGADHQHNIGVVGVAGVNHLVQDAPRRDHAHHGRLSGAGRHFAGISAECRHSVGLRILTRLVERDLNALKEIRSCLGQKDDRFSGLGLSEEQLALAAIPSPVTHEFHGCPRNSRFTPECKRSPFVELCADTIDKLQLDRGTRPGLLQRRFAAGRAVEVHCGPTTGEPRRWFVFGYAPVFLRLLVGRIEDRLTNLMHLQFEPPNASKMESSFRTTSGWISVGSINCAIS